MEKPGPIQPQASMRKAGRSRTSRCTTKSNGELCGDANGAYGADSSGASSRRDARVLREARLHAVVSRTRRVGLRNRVAVTTSATRMFRRNEMNPLAAAARAALVAGAAG